MLGALVGARGLVRLPLRLGVGVGEKGEEKIYIYTTPRIIFEYFHRLKSISIYFSVFVILLVFQLRIIDLHLLLEKYKTARLFSGCLSLRLYFPITVVYLAINKLGVVFWTLIGVGPEE